MAVQMYLTRRNLLTLLAKLDAKKRGIRTSCTLIKNDVSHKEFPQSHKNIFITALEDEDYYTDREPGPVVIDGHIF